MNLLSWNCRGLGNSQTVHALRGLVNRNDPKFIFLMETKINTIRMDGVRRIVGFENGLSIPSEGRSGGLAMLWRQGYNVNISSYSKYHIDSVVTVTATGDTWRLKGFYGHPETSKKEATWRLLETLNTHADLPWICVGDFNEILERQEKTGRIPTSQTQMNRFRDVINQCYFHEIKFEGPRFTWCNNRTDSGRVLARLDRGLSNMEWYLKNPNAIVQHIFESSSDHFALIVRLEGRRRQRGRPRFHFEAMWTRSDGCRKVIEHTWRSTSNVEGTNNLNARLQQCATELTTWNKKEFGNVTRQMAEQRGRLQVLIQEEDRGSQTVAAEINIVRRQLNELMAREEHMWRQRARVQWLTEGDKNTRYFHVKASQRSQRNEIRGIYNIAGQWMENQQDIKQIAVSFFDNLFTTSEPSQIQDGARAILPKVTQEMNDQLSREFTSEEVHKALQQMHPTKAPGPDGMSAIFFQKYWAIIGRDVTESVLYVLNGNGSTAEYNKTNIVLIPKTKAPQRMTEFRPISLCNVTYKLISKVIANRLKSILPDIISENQSTFVLGRNITDNALVVFELMHHFQQKRSGKDVYMAVKLDISKAYDRVEWKFVEQIMQKLGFCDRWIALIMKCITTVQYSVLINGDICGNIIPTRGLRQGDPLSPYLFLLCAEGFSSLLREAEENQHIQGVSVSRGGPRVSHLFFADDSILFCRANHSDCQQLLTIFDTYEKGLGQKINMDKSSIHFSSNTPLNCQREIKEMFADMRDAHPQQISGTPDDYWEIKNFGFQGDQRETNSKA